MHMSANPSPDPLISLFAAIRTWAEAAAVPAPAIYGLRQFFRQLTPAPTENENARVFYPRLLGYDDPDERPPPQNGARLTSRGTQTPTAPTPPANDPLTPDNAGLRNLWRCCPATPYHACLSSTRDDDVPRWRFHCGEHIPYDCLNGAQLRRAREARHAAARRLAAQ